MATRDDPTTPTLLARWIGPKDRSRHAIGVPARDLTTDDCTAREAARLVRDYPDFYASTKQDEPAVPAPAPRVRPVVVAPEPVTITAEMLVAKDIIT